MCNRLAAELAEQMAKFSESGLPRYIRFTFNSQEKTIASKNIKMSTCLNPRTVDFRDTSQHIRLVINREGRFTWQRYPDLHPNRVIPAVAL